MISQTLDRAVSSQKQKPKSHRISTAFKTVARQTKASWGYRLYKDYDQIKGKGQLNNQKTSKRNRNRSISNSSQKYSERPQTTPAINYKKSENVKLLMKGNIIKNPQQFNIQQEKKYSTLQTYGLGKFQFQNTIRGRLTFKPNHHLMFGNQTQRQKNINKIWYNPKIQHNKMSKTINNHKLKSHDFESYTQRSVFQPRDQVDKFYDIKKSKLRCSPKRIKQTVKLGSISGRKQQKIKPSAKLSYDQYQARKNIQPRSVGYQISTNQRIIKFGPQVIYDKRGCYR